MMLTALLLLAATQPAPPQALTDVVAALRSAAAWQAEFTQRYVPAGLQEGIQESGSLILVPPAQLRFDYAGEGGRIFATDGSVVRWVDPLGGTCDAFPLDQATWGRTPLAALLDEGAASASFTITGEGPRLRLVPRQPMSELAEMVVELGERSLPESVRITDTSNNVNQLWLSRWRSIAAPGIELFRPALGGNEPCPTSQ